METPAVMPDSAPVKLEVPTGDARAEWLMTGKLPIPEEKAEEVKTEAESSTAQDEPAESSTAQPEKAEEVVAKPKKRTESRFQELLDERKALWEENKTLREQLRNPKETQAEPSPAPQELKQPDINDFNTRGEYDKALREFYRAEARREAERVIRESQIQRDYDAKVKAGNERYENFDEIAKPVIDGLAEGVQGRKINPAVWEAIDDSPVFSDLLYVIGETEASTKDFLSKAEKNPRAAIKLVGALEQIIADELQKSKAPRDDKGQFVTKKEMSKAPPPPKELSGSGPPPDEVESAVQRGDFKAFKAAEDRRDLARRKG